MTRTQCYSSIFIYMYCINHQSCLFLVLVCDIAICMLRPIKYHCMSVFPYAHLMQIPCYVFSIVFLIVGFITMDQEFILACNPPLAYIYNVMEIWNTCYLVVCAATVIIYSTALVYTACCGGITRRLTTSKMSAHSIAAQQRIIKSLSALLVIFCLSWFLGAVAPRFAIVLQIDPKLIKLVQTYAVIPAILSYAQTYYIYFLVSRDYRDAFRKLGIFGFLRRKDQGGVSTSHTSVHRLYSR
ncbi:hypothetical protein PRIPAC_87522 [Pristionchus pacificus]|uniref:G protein-coupled receptor n=1 Tax=Pristionchus pacificus TaxID=54126 RepID=A0A2A6CVS2_PRIPA|nr:hypothetical protein PRIPAC_87522 [Pristionchus pacificus]|eukprot:PDM82147.1 G protein-coupled receptor [Pristionchus pacificus]